MSASPDFYYNPSAAPAFSPCASPPLLFAPAGAAGAGAGAGAGAADLDYYCRTPTGAGISYLREPDTCPPAPRKPPPPPAACRKRLFNVDAISLRLDDLERIFRPSPPQPHCDKRPRSPDRAHDELSSNPASTSSSGASSVA